MKRIIAAGLAGVTMFFTGCSSLAGSMEVDVNAIQTSAAQEAVTDENGENRLGITGERKEMPDYFQENLTEKFRDMGGKRAFAFKEGHSQEPGDIEDFHVDGLRDGTVFVYGYTTQVKEGTDQGKMVHCGAMYDYEKEDLHVFHENIYGCAGEDKEEKESFFIQVCGPGGDLFVYDNGHGYIYDSGGRLKFHSDIESFIRRQFSRAYSVSVINAVTDGQNRIYMEVSIETEEVEIPELKPEDLEIIMGRDVSQEADGLDEDLEGKVVSRILVYEFRRIDSTLDQNNISFEDQKKAWAAQTADQEYEAEPDQEEGWKQAVEEHPDTWGAAYLGDMDGAKVYQWKGDPEFHSEEGVTTFLPEAGSYVNYTDVGENQELDKVFIPIEDKYSDLFGRTGEFVPYDLQTIEREYTLVWYEEDEESREQVKHTRRETQILEDIPARRHVPLENAYVESYWVMKETEASSLGKSVGNEIQCTGEDGKVRWIQPGGKLKSTPYKVREDTAAGIFLEDGQVFYVEYGREAMAVVRDAGHGGDKDEKPDKILYSKLAGGYQPGDSVQDAILREQYQEDLPEMDSVYGSGYYTEDQVLHASLDLDQKLAESLVSRGEEGICSLTDKDSQKGFLLTSRERGLVYYAPASQKSAVLERGCWFGSWKQGDMYISVGFPNGQASYSGSDLAFARVYRYNLSALCNKAMANALDEILALEAEESGKQEEDRKTAEETLPEEETPKSPLDRWNEEYRDQYAQTYPGE